MDEMYAAPDDEERGLDVDIISGLAMAIIDDPNGMNTLVSAAQNTPDPAKGVAQYLMMMFDAVNSLLEQTGIPFDFSVIAAKNGVMDSLLPEIAEILAQADVPVDEAFTKNTLGYFLEMVKSAAQAEQGDAAPAAPASPTAGAGGLLASVGGM
jgi:hypothetical protein